MLRPIVAMISVFLAATCPVWCASVEAAWHGSSGHHSCEQDAHDESPSPQPVNDDDCLCQGAVSAPGVEDEASSTQTVIALDPAPLPTGGACAAHSLSLTISRAAAGRAAHVMASSHCVVLRC